MMDWDESVNDTFSTTDSQNHTLFSYDTDLDVEHIDDIPTIQEYIAGLNIYLSVGIALTNILAIIVISIFANRIKGIRMHTPKKFLTKTLILCGIYSVVAVSCSIASWIPKAMLLNETITNLSFFYCAYIFYSLCLDYADGESNFISIANGHAFSIRTPPCFCCCPCFTRQHISKQKFLFTRWMVLQLPIVHSVIYLILNVLFLEERRIYADFFLYLLPLIVVSIILGVWGLNITVRMISPYYADHNLLAKYAVIQLVLIFCKLQPALVQVIFSHISFEVGADQLDSRIYSNVTSYFLILIEMLILEFLALKYYQTPTKTIQK